VCKKVCNKLIVLLFILQCQRRWYKNMKIVDETHLKKINDLLKIFVVKAVEITLKNNSQFSIVNECRYFDSENEDDSFNAEYGETEKFSENLVKKFNIQVLTSYQYEKDGSEHLIKFEFAQELKEITIEFGIDNIFIGYYLNDDGFYEQSIDNADEFKSSFTVNYQGVQNMEVQVFNQFYEKLDKFLTYAILSTS